MIKKYIKRIIKSISINNFSPLNHIEINSDRLINNFNIFQSIQPNFSIIPVLKANAYGHGIMQVAKILNSVDCDMVAVDGYFEALNIIDITKHKILVLGYIKSENFKLLDTKKCSFVVQNIESLKALGVLKKPVNIHIELNTGMNRLGLKRDELEKYLKILKKYPKINLEGIMTHLADADNSDASFTNQQVISFDNLVELILEQGFKPKYFHIAQTSGSVKVNSKFANAMRIGIGLYGINPLGLNDTNYDKLKKLLPILELKSTIIKTIKLEPGDKVSYSGTFTANKPMRIGVLSLGYYEGVPRELSNIGKITIDDKEFPIIGNVCMNHTMIDLDDSKLKVGDEVVVISNNPNNSNSVANICMECNIFKNQFLTNISASIRRIII